MPTRSGSLLVQSTHGANGNFEVVVPRAGGGIAHMWRNNDTPAFPWTLPAIAFGSTFDITDVTAIESGFPAFRNLEVVAREGSTLLHNWRNDAGGLTWSETVPIPGATGVSGAPGFIQSTYGTMGNFEVVAPLAAGGLGHWWRNNDASQLPWSGPARFGTGTVHAAALIQSNFGAPGNLEVVARAGNQLVHYYRDGGVWRGPFPIGTGVAGTPAFIQGRFGGRGNFEVVAPLESGGMGHWWRDNDAPGFPWNGPARLGGGRVDAVGLVHSGFGNLEVVARSGTQLTHWFGDIYGWHGPYPLPAEPVCPETRGKAEIPFRSGAVAIHLATLRTGKLVLFGFDENDTMAESRVLNPATGAVHRPPATPHLFCSGHTFLRTGHLLVVGGHHGDVTSVHTFDPATQAWTLRAKMNFGRWYPTCTTLPDGRVLIVGGLFKEGDDTNNTWQIFDARGASEAEWRLGNELPLPSFSGQKVDLYPFSHVLPTGQVLVHSHSTTRFFHPATSTWDGAEIRTPSTHVRTGGKGTSVLLPLLQADGFRARVMALGGIVSTMDETGVATAEILELGADPRTARWQPLPSMSTARLFPNAVLLPDGKVLVAGGSAGNNENPVFQVESFDPALRRWTTLCSTRVPRLYHSTAVLLPDARVLMAGKDGSRQSAPYLYPEYRCEVFSPPYLFTGTPRPTFSGAPSAAAYEATVRVATPDPGAIGSASLVRPGSVTHCLDMEQRMVGLAIARETGAVSFRIPKSRDLLPPGWYMLFLVSTTGVPSVASFLRIG